MKKVLFLLLPVLLILCSGCGGTSEAALTITALKIGKADAIILKSPAGAVLIDTGEADDAEEILEKSRAMGIDRFDHLILSHYDKDHLGGAAEILAGIEIGQIIEPGYAWTNKAMTAYQNALADTPIPRLIPEDIHTFELDGVSYTVYPPKQSQYEEKNDYSMAVKVEYQGFTALFTGDALDQRTAELLELEDLNADILKVPHHGSWEESSESLFRAVSPNYSIITCSDKNPADWETVECLMRLGSKVLLTADGDIKLTIDTNGIRAEQK